MELRLLKEDEIQLLEAPIKALADYHNAIPNGCPAKYPLTPVNKTLTDLSLYAAGGSGKIMALFDGDFLAGFAALHFEGTQGWLDYLFIYEQYRGKGFGVSLMDWAMDEFKTAHVDLVQLKVVENNPTKRLYQKYGFAVRAEIMGVNMKKAAAEKTRNTVSPA